MRNLSEKHPVISVIILFVIGLSLGGVAAGVLNARGFDNGVGSSVARIMIAIVFLALNFRKFRFSNFFRRQYDSVLFPGHYGCIVDF